MLLHGLLPSPQSVVSKNKTPLSGQQPCLKLSYWLVVRGHHNILRPAGKGGRQPPEVDFGPWIGFSLEAFDTHVLQDVKPPVVGNREVGPPYVGRFVVHVALREEGGHFVLLRQHRNVDNFAVGIGGVAAHGKAEAPPFGEGGQGVAQCANHRFYFSRHIYSFAVPASSRMSGLTGGVMILKGVARMTFPPIMQPR